MALRMAPPRRARDLLALSGTALVALAALAACGPSRPSKPFVPTARVTVQAGQAGALVHPAVLGQAYLWPFAGMGSYNAQKDAFYPSFLHQLETVVHPGSLRYPGGITAESFQWERAVGPQAQRTANAFGPSSGSSPSAVGPDEFGQLLDVTGAAGVVTVNFDTGTAQQAAAFVSYMTGKNGTSQWADLRAKNGHPQPYNVPYWEVGNEESTAIGWRAGTPVTVGGPPHACGFDGTCLYLYGGSTRFSAQPVALAANLTPQAANSNGKAGQTFYVRYPPVAPGSATVYVDTTAWTEVSSLSAAGPTAQDYVLDPTTGEITFGNGVHGAVPPAGAEITASYVSGPHGGFVHFYRAMKAANPNIHVCTADPTHDFIVSAGTAVPYDCVQYHLYASTGTVPNNVPISQYQMDIMAASSQQALSVSSEQSLVLQYAKKNIPLVLTEYGQLLGSNPTSAPYYHISLDEALLNASQLAEWIRLGIPVADRQLLAGVIPPAAQCCVGLPQGSPYATTASIGGAGSPGGAANATVLEATGQVYNLFAPLAGTHLVSSALTGNPLLVSYKGYQIATLSLLTARSARDVYVLTINRSPTALVPTRISVVGATTGGSATYTLLDGATSLSYNTAAHPNNVRLTHGSYRVSNDAVDVNVPAHSVMTITIPVR